ncbi:unnamed protein product [Notodromas monacha]|uniref:Uncharacterized protein n=1 Tax=Notodromas monacha TaxID=399045 RepID=A0A7R9G838_9CRUS|nr:unnamed protein product [Notodromas monacha]CAG0912877.1 unnamed protein product [Notodromas monacha]
MMDERHSDPTPVVYGSMQCETQKASINFYGVQECRWGDRPASALASPVESKTTSHSSLATSSCSGSKEGDLAADFQRQATLSPGSGGTREASQPSSGHSSRIMSPAPSNVSSVRSTIVGIHSRSLAKKLQENGSVCSVHSAGTPSPVPSPVRKKCRGGIASRQPASLAARLSVRSNGSPRRRR